MTTKRFHKKRTDSEVSSEQAIQRAKIQIPIEEKVITQKKDIALMQTSQEQAKTTSIAKVKQIKIVQTSRKLLTTPVLIKPLTPIIAPSINLCIPSIPILFSDSVICQSSKVQIEHLLKDGLTKQKLITWIQGNNRTNFGFEGNCKLLALIESEHIWKNVLPSMLNDVKDYSQTIGEGKIRFLSGNKSGRTKLQIKRTTCYFLLCQMFFGLIPRQYHHLKSNVCCTFVNYMHRKTIPNNEGQQELSINQISSMNKIKALLHYFTVMSCQKNQQKTNRQTIFLDYQINILKTQTFLKPKPISKQQLNDLLQYEEYFGTIGDQPLADINLFFDKIHQEEDKFNQGQNTQQRIDLILSFVEIDKFIDEQKAESKFNHLSLNKFLFQHPQMFIAKLLVLNFQDERVFVTISNLKKYSNCRYKPGKQFHTISATKIQDLTGYMPKNLQKIVLIQKQTSNLSAKDYQFEKIKQKIQKYMGCIRTVMKSQKERTILVDFDEMKHKDLYLNFLLLWIAVSASAKSKCWFMFKLTNIDEDTQYNIIKLKDEMQQKQAGAIISAILDYEKFFNEKKHIFKDISELSFIQYVKRHLF